KTLGVDDTEVQADRSGAGDNDDDDDDDPDREVNFSTVKTTFERDKNAVDFSEINDLAVDNTEQEMFKSRYLQRGLAAVKTSATTAMRSGQGSKSLSSRLDSMDEDYDAEDTDEDTQRSGSRQSLLSAIALPTSHGSTKPAMTLLQQQQIYLLEEQQRQQQQQQQTVGSKSTPSAPALPTLPVAAAPAVTEPIDVRAIYPAFEEKKILKFSELFNTKRPKRFPHSRAKPAQFPSSVKFSKDHDQKKVFDQPEDPSNIQEQYLDYYDIMEETVDSEWVNSLQWNVPTTKDFYSVQLEPWEDKIIWDDAVVPAGNNAMNGARKNAITPSTIPIKDLFAVRNYDLENGDWEESIIWDENKPYKPFTQISLNMNDANVLFDLTTMDTKAMGDAFRGKRGKKVQLPAYRVVTKTNDPSEAETNRTLQIDRFNLSNDRFYEINKEGRFHRVRQTFGQLVVQHALPATKLMKPWYKNKLTKSELRSFHRPQLQATPNGKAMLKLWGAGDPTGRGEGFSFVRISMKDIFLRQGESLEERLAQIELLPKSTHRYNVAEQQQVYREEITRIWNAQHKALSNAEEIDGHNDEIAGSDEDEEESYNRQRRELSAIDRSRASPSPSLFGRYRDRDRDRDRDNDMDDDNVSVAGSVSSRTSAGNFTGSRNKYLVIKRLVRQPNGEAVWKTETIRDPAVMNNYIRHRQLIEESAISTEALEPTDDEAKNERRKKRILEEIARLNRNQERRMARAAAKAGTAPPEMPINPITASLKKKVVRQCSNCGALGHMKTNKKCPKYVDPSGALPNLGVTGTAYVSSGGIGTMIAPPHAPSRQNSNPPVAPAPMVRGSSVNGEVLRQGSPQSSGTGGNKISIPKAVIDLVVDQEKEREKEDKEALVVRLPSKMLQPPPKRKRSESTSQQNNDLEDFMDYLHPPIKSYGRRKKPDVELANIIEAVLATLLSMQEATEFMAPVSSKNAPGYDIVIKQPRDLSGMRDANRNYYAYRTVDAFLTDLKIMVNNSWMYNGEASGWTKAAMVLLEKAEEILKPQMETIRLLEQEILEADVKANFYGLAGTPGGTTGTPPPSAMLHPGGYGMYTSATFSGFGKPFLGISGPVKSHPFPPQNALVLEPPEAGE
ncbi:hypothetical protein BGX31_002208, partial [Mortierella sp. GBA43]